MTEQFLEDYFKGLATALKAIGHTDDAPAFYRMKDPMDLDEFDNAVKNMAKGVCLLLEIGDGSLGSWDAQSDLPRIGLHILIKTTEKFSDINAARDQAKAILLKMVSRIRIDCKGEFEREDNADGPLRTQRVVFDSNVKLSNMTAIDGNWYGKSAYFNWSVPVDLVYNPLDWN
jgi:hypothetical protein